MIQELVIPSEVNIKTLVVGRLEPYNSAKGPFEFIEVDNQGNEIPYDISAFDFELKVYSSNKLKKKYDDTNFVKSSNLLWLNIPNVELDRGVYEYKIFLLGGNSIIKGKFKVV